MQDFDATDKALILTAVTAMLAEAVQAPEQYTQHIASPTRIDALLQRVKRWTFEKEDV